MQHVVAAIVGFFIIVVVLSDGFEAIVLPRRVTRRFRLTRALYRVTWIPWSALARRMRAGKRREALLGVYGPFSLIMLLAAWALGLVFGFALVHWALGSAVEGSHEPAAFSVDLYFSGTTFFTLG